MIAIIHPILLYSINNRIRVTSTSVELSCMNMNYHWFTANTFSVQSRRVSQPVVSMNNIKIISTSNYTGNYRIVISLLKYIVWITTRKLNTTQVVCMHIVEISINIIPQFKILLGIHKLFESRFNSSFRHILPHNGSIIGTNNLHKALVFVPPGLRNNKYGFQIFLLCHTFS